MLDLATLLVTVIGGIAVLVSYYVTFRKVPYGYLDPRHPFWLGYSKSNIQTLVFFQLLAVIGFFLFLIPWIFIEGPQGGVLSHEAALPVVIGIFMVASTFWAPAMKQAIYNGSLAWKWVGAISLWVSAIMSIMLIAGASEETSPRWYVVLGTVLFAITVVLGDGIAYSARMLSRDITYN